MAQKQRAEAGPRARVEIVAAGPNSVAGKRVAPAQAAASGRRDETSRPEIPAFAGMTVAGMTL